MKKYIISYLIMNIILYLIVSFIHWDTDWITEIGKWDKASRFLFISLLILFQILNSLICALIYGPAKKNKL